MIRKQFCKILKIALVKIYKEDGLKGDFTRKNTFQAHFIIKQ